MTVGENLFLGACPRRRGLHRLESRLRAVRCNARRLWHPARSRRSRVGDLGVGQQQLVEIARALARKPKMLILDEPTAALARHEIDTLLDLVRDLRQRGVACIYISHKLDEVFAIADRITVLRDGCAQGTLTARGDGRRRDHRSDGRPRIEDLLPAPAVARRRARCLRVQRPRSTCERPRPAHLRSRGIDFEVRAGEVLGIGGLMGAGRTELLLHLLGLWGDADRGARSNSAASRLPRGIRATLLRRGSRSSPKTASASGLVLDAGRRLQRFAVVARQVMRRGLLVDRDRGSNGHAKSIVDGPAHQSRRPRATGRQALRRQPAESRARQGADDATAGHAARRADARHRRRREARDLRARSTA